MVVLNNMGVYETHRDRSYEYDKNDMSDLKREALSNTILINELGIGLFTIDNLKESLELNDHNVEVALKACNDMDMMDIMLKRMTIKYGIQYYVRLLFTFSAICSKAIDYYDDEFTDDESLEIIKNIINGENNHSDIVPAYFRDRRGQVYSVSLPEIQYLMDKHKSPERFRDINYNREY